MTKEKGCQWHFCKDDSHFNFGVGVTPQRSFRKAASAASIVRESLQNSIDAAVSYPVRVVYTKKDIALEEFPSLFGLVECSDGYSLLQHFEGMKNSIPENDVQNVEEYGRKVEYVTSLTSPSLFEQTVPCLCISDYNTTGMDYYQEKNSGTFASFVRSVGKNDKRSKSSAGSNGVGKGAYIQLSQFNTLIVSSRSACQTLFEGNMLMLSHYVDNQAYHPFAFYDSQGGNPVIDEKNIPDIFVREKIGTDINIIGIDDQDWDNQVQDMVIAVLKNFWFAIHKEHLVVEIEGIVINKYFLPDLLAKYFGDKKDGSQERTYNPLPYYRIVASDPSDKIIHRKDVLPLLGEVEFYLSKAKTGNGRILYMRESRMLIFSKVETMYNQINGVFVCTGGKGNEILKEAENEAHNEWKAKSGDNIAKEAIEELNKYIKDCLEEEIGSVTNSTVDIKRLANRLPITTEPVFDEDYDDEMDLEGDGNTITETFETTDASKIVPHKQKKEVVAKVHKRKSKQVVPEPQGEEYDETSAENDGLEIPSTFIPSDHPDVPGPGPFPGPTPNEELSSGSKANQESSEGETKKTVSINSFEPFAFARKVDNEYVYTVRIKCPKEHDNANIVVTVGGESNDEFIDIKESSIGTPEGHIIKGVHLIKGITSFTFKFKENEKNAVIISAYEYND